MARKKKEDPAASAPLMPQGAVELTQELAAVSLAILDKEDERKMIVKRLNGEITKLKKRQRDVATEIKSGGTQLRMMFGGATEPGKDAVEH